MSNANTAAKAAAFHLINSRPGCFVFVGRVPLALAFERVDGSPLTDADARDLAHVGPGFLRARITPRSWATREAAQAARGEVTL